MSDPKNDTAKSVSETSKQNMDDKFSSMAEKISSYIFDGPSGDLARNKLDNMLIEALRAVDKEAYERGKGDTKLYVESLRGQCWSKAAESDLRKAEQRGLEKAAEIALKEGNCGATFPDCDDYDDCECGTVIADEIRRIG